MMSNDMNRGPGTLTAFGFARVIALAVESVYTDEQADKVLTQMIDVFESATMPLGMDDKPNASEWCEEIAHRLSILRSELGR